VLHWKCEGVGEWSDVGLEEKFDGDTLPPELEFESLGQNIKMYLISAREYYYPGRGTVKCAVYSFPKKSGRGPENNYVLVLPLPARPLASVEHESEPISIGRLDVSGSVEPHPTIDPVDPTSTD